LESVWKTVTAKPRAWRRPARWNMGLMWPWYGSGKTSTRRRRWLVAVFPSEAMEPMALPLVTSSVLGCGRDKAKCHFSFAVHASYSYSYWTVWMFVFEFSFSTVANDFLPCRAASIFLFELVKEHVHMHIFYKEQIIRQYSNTCYRII
jgi:hypothetical protein